MDCLPLLDEHIDLALAELLNSQGSDAITVPDARLRGQSGERMFEFAAGQHRVVLTADLRGFPSLGWDWNGAGRTVPGVVIIHCQGRSYRFENLLRRIEAPIFSDPARLAIP